MNQSMPFRCVNLQCKITKMGLKTTIKMVKNNFESYRHEKIARLDLLTRYLKNSYMV